MGQDDFTSSYKILFLVKNEIIYLMQKNGPFYLILKCIYKLRKSSLKKTINIFRIVDGFINYVHLQSRQNIYIYICSDQSSDFFHQLYNYSKKILYETQQNIYI